MPAAPTASHRSALRQATAYNRCCVPLVCARHAPEITPEPPGPDAPGLARTALPQPAIRTAAAHSQTAALAGCTRQLPAALEASQEHRGHPSRDPDGRRSAHRLTVSPARRRAPCDQLTNNTSCNSCGLWHMQQRKAAHVNAASPALP